MSIFTNEQLATLREAEIYAPTRPSDEQRYYKWAKLWGETMVARQHGKAYYKVVSAIASLLRNQK